MTIEFEANGLTINQDCYSGLHERGPEKISGSRTFGSAGTTLLVKTSFQHFRWEVMRMDQFEALLASSKTAVERWVRSRLSSSADAEDILQETYLAAFQGFSALRNPDAFLP